MWFESIYWKEELGRIGKLLEPKPKPPRWSERLASTVQRDVSIGFFLLRRLIELQKVSSATSSMQMNVFGYKANKPITLMNRHDLPENYRWESEIAFKKSVVFIANQFVHSYVGLISRGPDRNWEDFFVASDFERNRHVWRVPTSEIGLAFETAAEDFPRWMEVKFNPDINDYEVKTN